ncbi:MAG: glycosyltransferase family 4 protein [Armatimonadetes bacterium]|nr:glycosyltransferase family 4 protein [Armatimonadota bacterium]
MIRVAQVVEAVEGGCKKHVLELATGLDPARFQQTVIHSCRRDSGFPEAIDDATGGAVETIPWNVLRRFCPLLDVQGYFYLGRLFREGDHDIIHCHSAKAGLVGRLASRRLRAARVYTPHCFPFRMEDDPLAMVLYRRLEAMAGQWTDRLVAVAPSEAELAREMQIVPPDRVRVIENGIDPDVFAVDVDPAAKRAQLGLAPEDRVLVSVGALRPQKGHRYLIEALPEVVQRHPGAHLLIAGAVGEDGGMADLAERLQVGRHVHLLGARSDIPALLGIADCFVLPSLWEGGPYALLEAMAAGAPVVASRIPGVTDWVKEGQTGHLAEPASPASLARAIDRALVETGLSRHMAAAAREMVRRRNTRDRWLADMAALYEELAGATSARS